MQGSTDSLKQIYDKFDRTQVIKMNQIELSDLMELHIEKLGRSFNRNCKDCVAKALKDVFNINIKPTLMGIRNQKMKQVFGLVARQISALKIESAFVINCKHGHLVNCLLSLGIQTEGIDPDADSKDFTIVTGRKAIKKGTIAKCKSLPEVDALIILDGTDKEIERAVKLNKAKYIITKLELDLKKVAKLKYIAANVYHAINANSNNIARNTV